MIIVIDPLAKPRMTRADKWAKRPCVLRYRAYKDELRLKGLPALTGELKIKFVLPMPKSWPKWQHVEMAGRPHQQKPDIDNLVKAIMDAGGLDDSHVWSLSATKVWGEWGYLEVAG